MKKMFKDDPEIENMNLHQVIKFDSTFEIVIILKVPGGWIYRFFDKNNKSISNGVFIPNY